MLTTGSASRSFEPTLRSGQRCLPFESSRTGTLLGAVGLPALDEPTCGGLYKLGPRESKGVCSRLLVRRRGFSALWFKISAWS